MLGIKLTGEFREGTTATDLVLTIAELLRRTGVVGKFVEFFGPGVARIPLTNRATLGNMSPEHGSTCAIFPVDDETLTYLRLIGRNEQMIRLVEAYAKEQGLWHDPDHEPAYSETTAGPDPAGLGRARDRVPAGGRGARARPADCARPGVGRVVPGQRPDLDHPGQHR